MTGKMIGCFLTYKGGKGKDAQTLVFGGKGNGGVNSLREHFVDDKNLYCLLRLNDKIDESVTTKFVFIHWMGNSVPFFQKGKITLHIAPVKEFVGQSHVDLKCNTLDEVTEDIVMEKVMDFSGSGSRVLDDQGQSQLKTQRTQKVGNVQTRRTTTEELTFDQDVISAIEEVRSNVHTWCLAGYHDTESADSIVLISKGNGDVEELKQHLNDNIVAYGLIRKNEKIDNSITVKFCYVRWIGPNIPRMQKAKLGVHINNIQKTFHPYHVDIQCERLDEISDAIVEDIISRSSGQKIHVKDNVDETTRHFYRGTVNTDGTSTTTTTTNNNNDTDTEPREPRAKIVVQKRLSIRKSVSGSKESSVVMKDEESIREYIQSVRRDDDPTDWCLITYDAPKSNTLVTLAKGSGGINELVSHLAPEIAAYGLYRKSDQIDLSETVKFCFIDWRGSNINYMQRAQLGTHSGFVTELFHPYHVDIQTSEHSDLSEEAILDKIRHSAGTKNWVK